jgi:hypothetical protein
METTTLSSKGQVIIAKAVFAVTDLDQVAGCLKTTAKAKKQPAIDVAMKRAARSLWRDLD